MTNANLDLKCPAGNTVAGASPDFAEANIVKCKVCGASVSADKYPVAGKVWFTITFGALFDDSATPAVKEAEVEKYEVEVLDDKKRPIDVAAGTLVATPVDAAVSGKYSTSCCQSDLHMLKVVGTMPATMKYLMVVPVKSGKVLPSGYITGALSDVATGTAVENNGTVTLKFASAAAAAAALADSKIHVTIINALAATIANVEASDIHINGITVGTSRRLLESANERRLSSAHLIVDYTILYSGTLTASDISAATLLDEFKAAATALGVSGAAATAIAGSIQPSIGTVSATSVGTPAAASFAAPSATSPFSFVLAAGMILTTVFQTKFQ